MDRTAKQRPGVLLCVVSLVAAATGVLYVVRPESDLQANKSIAAHAERLASEPTPTSLLTAPSEVSADQASSDSNGQSTTTSQVSQSLPLTVPLSSSRGANDSSGSTITSITATPTTLGSTPTTTGSTPTITTMPPTTTQGNSGVLSVRVVGNRLVDGHGNTLRLLGVNRPGMDYLPHAGQCWSIPADVAEVRAIVAWRANAVRIPLNQDCWLGINGVDQASAAAYRSALRSYVALLHQHELYAILDLHRSAPGTVPATAMQPMPDADHSPAFWFSVASAFVNDPAVVFDLYNEPHLGDVLPEGSDYWQCWLSGCSINVVYSMVAGQIQASQLTWRSAGMQELLNAVRSAGATQPAMLSGLNYANNLTPLPSDPTAGWLTYKPFDSAGQLIASIHVYNESDGCVDLACWNNQYGTVARHYPVVTSELGEDDCAHGFIDQYMQFADANGISYLGWSWSIETNCSTQGGMGLITDASGTPSSSGVGLRDHLRTIRG